MAYNAEVDELFTLSDEIHELEIKFDELREIKVEVVAILKQVATELDKHFSNISKAKVAGSATAIVGGVMAGIGFGLSFFTFGASLGLTIAGSVIAGVGGTTAAGASITGLVIKKMKSKEINETFGRYSEKLNEIMEDCMKIGKRLEEFGKVDENNKYFVCHTKLSLSLSHFDGGLDGHELKAVRTDTTSFSPLSFKTQMHM